MGFRQKVYDELRLTAMEGVLWWKLLSPLLRKMKSWDTRTNEGAPWIADRFAYLRDYCRGSEDDR